LRRRKKTRPRVGKSPEQWENYNAYLIVFRHKEKLDLLPWMMKWLLKRDLTVKELVDYFDYSKRKLKPSYWERVGK